MRVDWTSEIEGVTMRRLREFFRATRGRSWSGAYLAREIEPLGMPVNKLLDALLARGYIVLDFDYTRWVARDPEAESGEDIAHDRYRVDDPGLVLASASLTRTPRSKAEKALAALLERARAIDANEEYYYRITSITVFGSYLNPDCEELGDIDLVVNLTLREEDSSGGILRAFWRRQIANGVTQRDFIDYYDRPRREVLQALCASVRLFEVHDPMEFAHLCSTATSLLSGQLYPDTDVTSSKV